MTAEEAMAEIWAITGADCGPEDYEFMAEHVRWMAQFLRDHHPTPAGELPVWLKDTPEAQAHYRVPLDAKSGK
jgi:hypothetical protein